MSVIKHLRIMKFASTSAIATGVDYALFFGFTYLGLAIQFAHFFSFVIASAFNFVLQKRYIFELNRKVHHAFLISVTFSLISILLSTGIIYHLGLLSLWEAYPVIPKLITTGLIFFFYYFTKRYAFQARTRETSMS